jgi:STE24 endopeptidase
MAYQLALLAAFTLIGALLDLPFELYSTFRSSSASASTA